MRQRGPSELSGAIKEDTAMQLRVTRPSDERVPMLFVREIEKDSDRLVNAEYHFGSTGNRLKMKYTYIQIYNILYS